MIPSQPGYVLSISPSTVTHDAYDLLELHRQYGPLVRYGPNTVSTANWEDYKQIYNPQNSPFMKHKKFYMAFVGSPSVWNVFTQT